MTYSDYSSYSRRRTNLRRSPLPADRPQVDEAVRDSILEASERLPNFTAAEIVAELGSAGVHVHRDDVRAVWEA